MASANLRRMKDVLDERFLRTMEFGKQWERETRNSSASKQICEIHPSPCPGHEKGREERQAGPSLCLFKTPTGQ